MMQAVMHEQSSDAIPAGVACPVVYVPVPFLPLGNCLDQQQLAMAGTKSPFTIPAGLLLPQHATPAPAQPMSSAAYNAPPMLSMPVSAFNNVNPGTSVFYIPPPPMATATTPCTMPASPSSNGPRGSSCGGHETITSHTAISVPPMEPVHAYPSLEHASGSHARKDQSGASSLCSLPVEVKELLQGVPEELQPTILAKATSRGRGGRPTAADPRAVNPDIDEKKARRIIANRQSAARSKLKTRVLEETLRVSKDVFTKHQSSVQSQLSKLKQMVDDLQTRNQQLEAKLGTRDDNTTHAIPVTSVQTLPPWQPAPATVLAVPPQHAMEPLSMPWVVPQQ